MAPLQPRKRLEFLDALRGIAAAYVVVFHAAFVPGFKLTPPSDIKNIIVFGASGVTLFFVISAFSLVMTMGRHMSSDRPMVSFFASRFFRIAPLFYFMIAFTLFFHWQSFGLTHSAGKIAASVFFVFNFVPEYQDGFVWASWTIGVEMVFYALFPALYFVLDKTWKKMLATAIAIAVASQLTNFLEIFFPSIEPANYYLFSIIRHLPVFMIGMIAFDLFNSYSKISLNLRPIGAILIIISFSGLGYLAYGGTSLPFMNYYYWQASFYALVLIGTSMLPLRIIVNKATKFMGKISYSMYLAHAPILFFLSPVYQTIYETGAPKPLAYTLAVATTYAIVIPISYFLYMFIELPGERIGKKFISRFSSTRQPLQQATTL